MLSLLAIIVVCNQRRLQSTPFGSVGAKRLPSSQAGSPRRGLVQARCGARAAGRLLRGLTQMAKTCVLRVYYAGAAETTSTSDNSVVADNCVVSPAPWLVRMKKQPRSCSSQSIAPRLRMYCCCTAIVLLLYCYCPAILLLLYCSVGATSFTHLTR